MKSISEAYFSGNLLKAKRQIQDALNQKNGKRIEEKASELVNPYFLGLVEEGKKDSKKAGRKILGLKKDNVVVKKQEEEAFAKLDAEV